MKAVQNEEFAAMIRSSFVVNSDGSFDAMITARVLAASTCALGRMA